MSREDKTGSNSNLLVIFIYATILLGLFSLKEAKKE